MLGERECQSQKKRCRASSLVLAEHVLLGGRGWRRMQDCWSFAFPKIVQACGAVRLAFLLRDGDAGSSCVGVNGDLGDLELHKCCRLLCEGGKSEWQIIVGDDEVCLWRRWIFPSHGAKSPSKWKSGGCLHVRVSVTCPTQSAFNPRSTAWKTKEYVKVCRILTLSIYQLHLSIAQSDKSPAF